MTRMTRRTAALALALLLAEEGRRTPADVFLSQSPGATGFLAGEGLLGRLDERLLLLLLSGALTWLLVVRRGDAPG
jgi:ABC-type Fe3+ transport system substrate-binding protein